MALSGRSRLGSTLLVLRPRDSLSFFDRNIAIDREIGEAVHAAARLRPFDFEPVELCRGSDAEDLTRVVRGKIAAAAVLEARPFHPACRPGEARSDGVAIA